MRSNKFDLIGAGEPPGNATLLRLQVAAFKQQIPLMYFIVCLNTVILSWTHFLTAPKTHTLIFPVLLIAASLLRIWRWWRVRHDEVSTQADVQILRSTNIFAVVLGVGFVIWALALYPYGNAYQKMHVAFFMGLTSTACVLCLMHMRTAATLLCVITTVPFALFFGSSGNPVQVAVAINMVLVGSALFVIQRRYYADFEDMAQSKAELQRLHDEMLNLAESDSLTGLANRRRFFSTLEQRLACQNGPDKALVIGLIDLDGFKPVNDVYGHQVGDQILVDVAHRLREVCNDAVCLARLGGDEFGVILEGEKSDAELRAFGLAVCIALRAPFAYDDLAPQIGGSMGMARYPQAAQTIENLYERADYALYHAKNNARGTTVLFNATHERAIRELSLIKQKLRNPDIENEMDLAFQPIIDTRTGDTIAFEALARWSNPELGNVPPSLFILAAEHSGLIGNLTEILLKKALLAAACWPSSIRLSFNLSAFDISSREAVSRISATIRNGPIDPSRIDLEVTETALLKDFGRARQMLNRLKKLGVSISLDDFGSGYSNLSYVHKLPLDKIKIDRSFVARIEADAASADIVRTIVDMSRSLSLDCIVEGVETRQQFDIVQGVGASLMQGHLFAKPMSASKIDGYLSAGFPTVRKHEKRRDAA